MVVDRRIGVDWVEVSNSPTVHTFVASEDDRDFEHFVRLELCHHEGFGKALSDVHVQH